MELGTIKNSNSSTEADFENPSTGIFPEHFHAQNVYVSL